MILLNNVVEVFDPTDLNANLVLRVVNFDRRHVGATLVDLDDFRRTIMPDRLAEETRRGFTILFGGQEQIQCRPGLVDCPIQVIPGDI